MTARRTGATALRVLTQLRRDPRTIAMLLVIPCLLLTLLRLVLAHDRPLFDRIGPASLGIFPLTTMFVVTSVAMLRERTGGTLERLLTTPLGKLDLLGGYALAFGSVAVVQAGVAAGVAFGPLGLHAHGSLALIVLLAVLDALLGTALGLLMSAFATTEFQAVQFLPAFVVPQLLLCGLVIPRGRMLAGLRAVSDVLPLSYAVDGMQRVTREAGVGGRLVADLGIVAGCMLAALAVAAATLRRRSA